MKQEYESIENLREYLQELKGRKFELDCGHRITFGYNFGNNILIYNGKRLEIICTDCGY